MLKRIAFIFLAATFFIACSSRRGAYSSYDKSAVASYYANKFNGRKTASGERFNNNKLTAAHRKLDFGTKVKVTNKANGKWVIVEVNDRGPFGGGRDIDLSKKAFMQITDNKNHGEIKVTLEIAK